MLVAYYNRGIACYNKGDLDQALASWTRAIQLGFTRVEVFCSRGILHARRRDPQKAIADFDEAIRIDPQYAPAYNHRAVVRDALGQADEAADDRAEATRLPDIQKTSTTNNKAAGEDSLPTTPLTGQASPERLVCASEEMMSCILRRTVSVQESRTMSILPLLGKLSRPAAIRKSHAHVRHLARLLRPHRLSHEPLEARHLLSTVSGAVFEDLNANGVQDAGEAGIPDFIVVLESENIDAPVLTIDNPTPEPGDRFGRGFTDVGGKLVIGAPRDNTGAAHAGSVYVFNAATGVLETTINNPTPDYDDIFGAVVGKLDDRIIVGAPWDDTDGVNAGIVYLFDLDGDRLATFHNPSPTDPWFSSVASVSGKVLIGHQNADAGATDSGAVYVFGDSGELEQTILNPFPEENAHFGARIASQGDTFFVSAAKNNGVGVVYMYSADGQLLQTFDNPTPERNYLGIRIAPSDNQVLIGAYDNSTAETLPGLAHLFDLETGDLIRTFASPNPSVNDSFGSSLAFVGGLVAIGAKGDDTFALDGGAVYLFDVATGQHVYTYSDPTPDNGEWLGCTTMLAVDGRLWVSAAPRDTLHPGVVYAFQAPARAVTDAQGNYTFTDLEDGTYRLRQISPEGYFQTAPGGGRE